MNLDQMILEIQRLFPYLFETFGFKILYTSATGPDNREMIIGLGNGDLHLKFYADASISILVADNDAPFDYDDAEHPRWIRFSSLVSFLEQTHIELIPSGNVSPSALEQLSQALQPRLGLIITMLKSQTEWIDSFRKLEREAYNRFWRRYNISQRPLEWLKSFCKRTKNVLP